jgi:hypothetical protein
MRLNHYRRPFNDRYRYKKYVRDAMQVYCLNHNEVDMSHFPKVYRAWNNTTIPQDLERLFFLRKRIQCWPLNLYFRYVVQFQPLKNTEYCPGSGHDREKV